MNFNLTETILIFVIIGVALAIYLSWLFLKTAIARGVEDGIYNAIIELKKDKVTENLFAEMYYMQNKFDKDIPPSN